MKRYYGIFALIALAFCLACSPVNYEKRGTETVVLTHVPPGPNLDTSAAAQTDWPRWTLEIPRAFIQSSGALDTPPPADQWVRLNGLYARGTDGSEKTHFRVGYQTTDQRTDPEIGPWTNFSVLLTNKTSSVQENGPCRPVNARRIAARPDMFGADGCTLDARTKLCSYTQQIENWSVRFSIDRSLEGGAQSYCPVFINFLENLTTSRKPID